jgi:hypothetical protein
MSYIEFTGFYFPIGTTPAKELHQIPLHNDGFLAKRPGSRTPTRAGMSCLLGMHGTSDHNV